MFAIYAAAIMSLKDDECRQRFYELERPCYHDTYPPQKPHCRGPGLWGLAASSFFKHWYFISSRCEIIYEPRAVWSLTGVAVRIAQSMGLERDGGIIRPTSI